MSLAKLIVDENIKKLNPNLELAVTTETIDNKRPTCGENFILVNRIKHGYKNYCLDKRNCYYKKEEKFNHRQLCTYYSGW